MTICSGKSCSFGYAAGAFRKLLSIYVFSYIPFGFERRIWDLIVSGLDHCLSFYFARVWDYFKKTCRKGNFYFHFIIVSFLLVIMKLYSAVIDRHYLYLNTRSKNK